MKHFKIILSLFLFIGLVSFMPSDSAKNADSNEIAKPFKIHVQKVNQDPKTENCYEQINKLTIQKEFIQNSIDSVFNVLDSLQTSKDSTRHAKARKIVLLDRNGGKEGTRNILSERNQQKDFRLERFTNNAVKQSEFDPKSNLYARLSNFKNKTSEGSKNSLSRSWDNSINNNNSFFEINGKAESNTFGNSWNDNRGSNNILCSIPIDQNQEQNRFFRNTERQKCRIRQTAGNIRGKDKSTLIPLWS